MAQMVVTAEEVEALVVMEDMVDGTSKEITNQKSTSQNLPNFLLKVRNNIVSTTSSIVT